MSLGFKFRDLLLSPKDIVEGVGIKPGFFVLDYGCGPGSYSIAAAEFVGPSGKVYALDIQPLAVRRVQSVASRRGLATIETICSDSGTGLADHSVHVALLYDTLHELDEPKKVLEELYRVLKPGGILSVSDHHMKEDEIISTVTRKGLFSLTEKRSIKGKKTYRFTKEPGYQGVAR
jgi:ubiquinone/menaquinone biosynthesis C-methylase UbiE